LLSYLCLSWKPAKPVLLSPCLLNCPSIITGDFEIISMHRKGDGAQKLELFKRPAEKVCENLYPTNAWLDVSTLASKSTWTLMETDYLLVMPIDQSLSNRFGLLRCGDST
jgi:hypothetical protein